MPTLSTYSWLSVSLVPQLCIQPTLDCVVLTIEKNACISGPAHCAIQGSTLLNIEVQHSPKDNPGPGGA